MVVASLTGTAYHSRAPWFTRWLPLVYQELLTILEHIGSHDSCHYSNMNCLPVQSTLVDTMVASSLKGTAYHSRAPWFTRWLSLV